MEALRPKLDFSCTWSQWCSCAHRRRFIETEEILSSMNEDGAKALLASFFRIRVLTFFLFLLLQWITFLMYFRSFSIQIITNRFSHIIKIRTQAKTRNKQKMIESNVGSATHCSHTNEYHIPMHIHYFGIIGISQISEMFILIQHRHRPFEMNGVSPREHSSRTNRPRMHSCIRGPVRGTGIAGAALESWINRVIWLLRMHPWHCAPLQIENVCVGGQLEKRRYAVSRPGPSQRKNNLCVTASSPAFVTMTTTQKEIDENWQWSVWHVPLSHCYRTRHTDWCHAPRRYACIAAKKNVRLLSLPSN